MGSHVRRLGGAGPGAYVSTCFRQLFISMIRLDRYLIGRASPFSRLKAGLAVVIVQTWLLGGGVALMKALSGVNVLNVPKWVYFAYATGVVAMDVKLGLIPSRTAQTECEQELVRLPLAGRKRIYYRSAFITFASLAFAVLSIAIARAR